MSIYVFRVRVLVFFFLSLYIYKCKILTCMYLRSRDLNRTHCSPQMELASIEYMPREHRNRGVKGRSIDKKERKKEIRSAFSREPSSNKLCTRAILSRSDSERIVFVQECYIKNSVGRKKSRQKLDRQTNEACLSRIKKKKNDYNWSCLMEEFL